MARFQAATLVQSFAELDRFVIYKCAIVFFR
jgi:hypothetical protein